MNTPSYILAFVEENKVRPGNVRVPFFKVHYAYLVFAIKKQLPILSKVTFSKLLESVGYERRRGGKEGVVFLLSAIPVKDVTVKIYQNLCRKVQQ